MATFTPNVRGNLRNLQRLIRGVSTEQVQRRALARGRRDFSRLLVRHIRREITAVGLRRRSGALRRVNIINLGVRGSPPVLHLFPNFPRTRYRTPPTRGRRSAAKNGQYAFVLNANPARDSSRPRAFIQRAGNAMIRDPQTIAIYQKHYAFILQSLIRRQSR